jgi:hypothetical protein
LWKERREIENLQNEKAKLKSMVTEFKSNNEEYFKIKEVAQENMKDVLTNGKLLLQFATASVIESLRRNPELCNFVLNDVPNNNHTTPYGSSGLSLMLPRKQQSSSYIDDDIYSALILEESEKLYNKLTRKLTNEVSVASTVDFSASSLPSLSNNNN